MARCVSDACHRRQLSTHRAHIRVLERAADEGLLKLNDAFERLKQTDFWISHQLLDERLKLFEQQQGGHA